MCWQQFKTDIVRRIILVMTAMMIMLSNLVLGQGNLFDTLKVDRTTKIIGRYPQYDKTKTFKKYNFIIEDSTKIEDFIRNIKLGDEIENSAEEPNFRLTVIKNFGEIGTWTISPNLKSAMTHDGHTYKFDFKQIGRLNKTYPFDYWYDVKTFDNKKEYEEYLTLQKKNVNFVFDYGPEFKYEGSFQIEFPKNSKFPHPKAVSEFLTPYIEKIEKKEDYSLRYELNEKNMKNHDQYTMTIMGSKKLFDQLKLDNLKNENWKPTVEEAYFFYKK
jgi:hypothetical protein